MRRRVSQLKLVIAALFVGLLACQVVLLPWMAASYAAEYPEYAGMRTPLLGLSIAILGVLELGLVGLWRLATLASDGALLASPAADRWLRTELAAAAAATLLGVATLAVIDQPIEVVLLPATVLLGSGAVLVVAVLRGLLREATARP